MKNNRQRIGCFDPADRAEIDLTRGGDALGRMHNALVARLDIGRGQTRAVVEQHVRSQLERISLPVWRGFPGLRQVADDLRIIAGIKFEKRRIMRRNRVQKRKRGVAVTVVISRLHRRGKFQHTATLRRDLRARRLWDEYSRSKSNSADEK